MTKKRSFLSTLFGGRKSGGCCSMEIVENTGSCCESDGTREIFDAQADRANILILGPGCKNCKALEKNVETALKKTSRSASLDHVTDFEEIAKYGIMSTPGLVIDGNVVSAGKVLKPDEIAAILEK